MAEMNSQQCEALARVLDEVDAERHRQHAKWGEQGHPSGTDASWRTSADWVRQQVEKAAREGRVTFLDILQEEVLEVFAETDPARLRAELVQVAAVAVQWIEAIDRRKP